MTRYNAPANRSCPVCYRAGTLTGDLADGSVLECNGGMAPGRSADLRKGGCLARFTFRDAQHSPSGLATLERLDVEQWNHGARIADDHHCSGCGARGHASLCGNCSRDEARA